MKALIKAYAATPNQYRAVKSFRLLNEIFQDGYLICYQIFDSEEEAKRFLQEKARMLYSEDLEAMNENMWSRMLIFETAAALILKGEEMKSFLMQINKPFFNHV